LWPPLPSVSLVYRVLTTDRRDFGMVGVRARFSRALEPVL
jgi:hypothetical protein